MNRLKNLLLAIDMQNDFCMPEGALYVKGAEKDVKQLAEFLKRNSDKIDHIILTQDCHQVIDISHPAFWIDCDGNHPPPFTAISPDDLREQKWMPLFSHDNAFRYVNDLSRKGEYPHTIWPEHCIAGSEGAAIADDIMEQVKNWARSGRFYDLIIKGSNPLTEHFGALRANIPIPADPETTMNIALVNTLKSYENILIAGEARSHCVANTVKQMLEIEGLPERLNILWDVMSDVNGFEELAIPIYDRAKEMGAKQIRIADLKLE